MVSHKPMHDILLNNLADDKTNLFQIEEGFMFSEHYKVIFIWLQKIAAFIFSHKINCTLS